MTRRVVFVALILFSFGAGDRPSSPQEKYDEEIQKASDAWWAAVVAADKKLIADIESSPLAVGGGFDARSAVVRRLTVDEQCLREHRLLPVNYLDRPSPSPQTKLKIGMTEKEADVAEGYWTKKVNVSNVDGVQIDYISPVIWPSNLQERDACYFVDKKLASIDQQRMEDGGRKLSHTQIR